MSAILAVSSCNRSSSTSTVPASNSVAQRVTNLEEWLNAGSKQPSEDERRKESEKDLAEIRRLGLVDRAQRDFQSRVAGASIDDFRISYFKDTNVVWCSVYYKLPGNANLLNQDFGYKRMSGTNWNLMWNDEGKP